MLKFLRTHFDDQASKLNISTRLVITTLIITLPLLWFYHERHRSQKIIDNNTIKIEKIDKNIKKNIAKLNNAKTAGITEEDLINEDIMVKKIGKALQQIEMGHRLKNNGYSTRIENKSLISKAIRKQNIRVRHYEIELLFSDFCDFIYTIKKITSLNLPIHWENIQLNYSLEMKNIIANISVYHLEKST